MTSDQAPAPKAARTANPVFRRALVWGAIATAVIAVAGGAIGFAVAGSDGLFSALAGAALAFVFMGLTAVTILVANRWTRDQLFSGIFFGVVLGGWLLKLVLFVIVLIVLRGAPWIQPQVFFFAVVASVLTSLAIDAVVMIRTRAPYVDVALPEQVVEDTAPSRERRED